MQADNSHSFRESLQALKPSDHACLIYDNREELLTTTITLLIAGLDRGERCLCVVDENSEEEVINALGAAGIDVDAAVNDGNLSVVAGREIFLHGDAGAPELMVQYYLKAIGEANRQGYPALRIVGEMNWALSDLPGLKRLPECGALLNTVFRESNALLICQYNRNRFSPEMILNIIYTHPLIILGGNVCNNSYYIPPEEYLTPHQPALKTERLLQNLLEQERIKTALVRGNAELERANRRLQKEITERRWIEEELGKTKEFLSKLLDNAPAAIYVKSTDGCFRLVNRAWENMLMLDRENVVGSSTEEVFRDETARLVSDEDRQVIATGLPVAVEQQMKLPGGHRWYHTVKFPLHDAQGNIEALGGISIDITERKQAEETLREKEELLLTILRTLPVGVWITDKDGNISQCNPAGRAIWRGARYVGREQYGEYKGWWPETAKRIESGEWALTRAISRGETSIGETIDIECFDGTRKTILNSAAPLHNRNQEIIGAVVVNQDITDQKRVQEELRLLNAELDQRISRRTEELEASNRELESFCYTVSHELRAPIARMEGFGRILDECVAEGDTSSLLRYSERIIASARRMRTVVDTLLMMTRLSRADVVLERIDLSEIARQVVAELLESVERRSIKVTIAPGICLNGDRQMLSICLRNLIGNAFKYTANKTSAEIEFGATCQSDKRVYFVKDNGDGFDMAFAGKLFQPFSRLHNEGEFEGNGIGLATVKRIVERHGGHIWAEASPGQGASFFFTIGQ